MAVLQLSDYFRTLNQQGYSNTAFYGTDFAALVQFLFTYNTSVTAAPGTIGNAVQLTAFSNIVGFSTNATAAVALPIALPPKMCFITNQAANPIQVYGTANPSNSSVVDAIIGHNTTTSAATATGVSQTTATIALYLCPELGLWKQMLTG